MLPPYYSIILKLIILNAIWLYKNFGELSSFFSLQFFAYCNPNLLKVSSAEIVFSNFDFSYIYNICFSSLVISSSIYPKSSHKISILLRFFTANPYSTITSTTSSTVNLEKYSPISTVSNFSLTSSLVYFTSFKRFSISLKSSFFPKKSP